MSDKIEEIHKRHAFADENKSVIRPTGFSWTIPGWQAHNDRAFLLAEVDRQRAENERLRAELEVERLRLAACDVVAMADTPESAIEARQIKPDYRSAALTRVESRVDEVIALRAENEKLRAENERLRANLRECACDCSSIRECAAEEAKGNYCLHLNARKALEGKP